MYKVVNATKDQTISDNLEYDDALKLMSSLNTQTRTTLIARNWYKNVERELYRDSSGKEFYGRYVLIED